MLRFLGRDYGSEVTIYISLCALEVVEDLCFAPDLHVQFHLSDEQVAQLDDLPREDGLQKRYLRIHGKQKLSLFFCKRCAL